MRSELLLFLALCAPAAAEGGPPRVAVIIDDFGLDSRRTPPDADWLALPHPLSFAVMPDSPRTKSAAGAVRAAGRELLIHFPFDPFLSLALPPDAVDPEDVAKTKSLLERAFRDIPGAKGLNNHRSTRATSNRPFMREFMRLIKGRVDFFLDSRTTSKSVAYDEARAAGIPALAEYTFLDTDKPGDKAFCVAMLERAVARARRRGEAVAIGHHYWPQTLECLKEELPRHAAAGVEFVTASQLAR